MVMVTHDANAAVIADRILFLGDGQVVEELPRSNAGEILAAMNRASA
jgi:putative ABC transport system ATP-binding protein